MYHALTVAGHRPGPVGQRTLEQGMSLPATRMARRITDGGKQEQTCYNGQLRCPCSGKLSSLPVSANGRYEAELLVIVIYNLQFPPILSILQQNG